MISQKTKKIVWIRDNEKCVITGSKKDLERTPHHCFYLSEYFENDRNDIWNLVTIGREPHRLITFPSNDKETAKGKEYAKKCKEIAFTRYNGKYRDKLTEIAKSRYGKNWLI